MLVLGYANLRDLLGVFLGSLKLISFFALL